MSKIMLERPRFGRKISRKGGAVGQKCGDIPPAVTLLSNNKTRAFFSSLGHVAVYDGLLPLVLSDFDRRGLGWGLCVRMETSAGLFSPMPLAPVPRGFRGEYRFEKTQTAVSYTARFTGRGQMFTVSADFTVSPVSSLLTVACAVSGDVEKAPFLLSFSPILKKESMDDPWIFSDCTDEKGRFFLRERTAGNGKAEPLYFGVSLTREMGNIPLVFSPSRAVLPARVRSECVQTVTFSLAAARDPDDLTALLGVRRDDFLYARAWEAVLCAQQAASGVANAGWITEEMLLSRMAFGAGRFSAEKRRRSMQSGALRRLGLAYGNPLVVAVFSRFGGEVAVRFRALVSLFRCMCIRGVPFDLVIVCRGDEAFRGASAMLHELRLEEFSFYAGGIFLLDAKRLYGRASDALYELATAKIDLERAVLW